MTKPEREKRTVWTTWEIKDGRPVGELVADIFKLLEQYGDSLVIDGYNDIGLKYERWETDAEYDSRVNYEAKEVAREKRQLKILLEKYGLPEEDLENE